MWFSVILSKTALQAFGCCGKILGRMSSRAYYIMLIAIGLIMVSRFICSSNNHIGRITKMVQSLCTEFSPALCTIQDDTNATTYHAFPSPKQLSHPSVAPNLRELGFGYRAEYVQRTAEMLCSEHKDPEAYLLSLRQMGESEARQELLKLCGVGPKVADCVLLMSLDKRNVVPGITLQSSKPRILNTFS
jgi:8-oxoguanine DNA-glycosylase Ogg